MATSSFGFLAFTVHHSSTSVWFFPCFGDGQRLYTCVLTGPLVSHASTSVACVLGSVACVYFCRMRLVHIELSELERTRSFPYSSSLYAPKGTEDASLGHKDSLAQPSRFYAMASRLQDRQHLRGGVAYDVARSAGPGARFLLPLPGSANLPLAVCLLTFRLLLRTRTLAYYSPSFSRPTPTPFFFTSTTILFVFSTQRITTSFIFPMFLRHGRCMCSTKDATTILTHSSVS